MPVIALNMVVDFAAWGNRRSPISNPAHQYLPQVVDCEASR